MSSYISPELTKNESPSFARYLQRHPVEGMVCSIRRRVAAAFTARCTRDRSLGMPEIRKYAACPLDVYFWGDET
jgi:hypothetical protein